jgi:hypothetical protein
VSGQSCSQASRNDPSIPAESRWVPAFSDNVRPEPRHTSWMTGDSAYTKKQPIFFMMALKASVQQGQRVRLLLLCTAQKNLSVRSREFGRWGVGRYCIAGASDEEQALVGARSSSCSHGKGNRTVVHGAQRRSPVSSCAFCEQK